MSIFDVLQSRFGAFIKERRMTKEDPETWREEYRKKQAAGVKFEHYEYGAWRQPNGYFDFTGKKEEYREVQEDPKMLTVESIVASEHLARTDVAPLKPVIHHIAERKLWLSQRGAGTNEVWQYHHERLGIGEYADIEVGREPKWCPENEYRTKPNMVMYYFALLRNGTHPFTLLYRSKDRLISEAKRNGYTIIGNIEEREVEV